MRLKFLREEGESLNEMIRLLKEFRWSRIFCTGNIARRNKCGKTAGSKKEEVSPVD